MKKYNYKELKESAEKIVFIVLIAGNLFLQFFPSEKEFIGQYPYLSQGLLCYFIYQIYQKILMLENRNTVTTYKFDDALNCIVQKKRKFKNVYIFAYSAQNYIKKFKREEVEIENLYLLLRRHNVKEAFLSTDEEIISNYEKELTEVIHTLDDMQEKKLIKNLHIRFFEFEAYSHFGIFDSNLAVAGELIHTYSRDKVKISHVRLYDLNSENIIKNYQSFFDAHFNVLTEDSGLKTVKKKFRCETCKEIAAISDSHLCRTGANIEACNFSIIKHNLIKEFVLMPDMRPLSRIHLLLTTNFHILSLYQYLRHEGADAYLEDIVTKIDRGVYESMGEHIIIFEHGSGESNSEFSGKSVEHMHMHILLKSKNQDIQDIYNIINNDDENIVNAKDSKCSYTFENLSEFKNLKKAAHDYFLVWDPTAANKRINVYFPRKKESQYLRRIYFSTMTDEEKKNLRLITDDISSFRDGYDWKKYDSSFTKAEQERYIKAGETIEKYLEDVK